MNNKTNSQVLGHKIEEFITLFSHSKLDHSMRDYDLKCALRLLEPVSVSLVTGNVKIELKNHDTN